MCASENLITCTTAHTHKSGKSPWSATAAAAAAAVAAATTAVAAVVVATVAVASTVASALAVGTAVTAIWNVVHHVEVMRICSKIAMDNDAEHGGVEDRSFVNVAQFVIVLQLGGRGGRWSGNDRSTIVLACRCRR